MNGVQTRFKCKLDVKRCKRFVFPPSSLLPRSNALKTKAIRYFQTDRTLTRIVSPPLRVLAAQGGTVTVDKGRVTYPEVNKNKIEYNSFLISDINYIKDDDEENQFKVSLPDKYIVFEIKYFASQEDFDEFRSLFN